MKISVLDKGYIEFIEPWGRGKQALIEDSNRAGGDHVGLDDCDYECGIIEAARQSTQGSFRGWEGVACNCNGVQKGQNLGHTKECSYIPGDKKLLASLYKRHHDTPFEFAGMIVEVQAPIMVFREWHRHRTQSYNEMSARYEPLPDLYYDPSFDNVAYRMEEATKTSNRQASGINSVLPADVPHTVNLWLERLARFYRISESHYQNALEEGIPKELARLVMPVGHYSRMRASANLRNWLSFMTLRCDPVAQWELRQYANALASIVAKVFPNTYSNWYDTIENRLPPWDAVPPT